MFDKLAQIKQLKELQDSLKDERVSVEENGVSLTINGKMQVEEITLNENLDKQDQGKALKECFNKAMKKIQMSVAQKMSGLYGN